MGDVSPLGILMSESGIPSLKLLKFIKTSPYRYRHYTIPKRNGGTRPIAQPSKALKFLQRLLVEKYLGKFSVHSCATAYVKGSGISENAKAHVENQYLTKLDFENFFPSLIPDDLISALKVDLTEVDKFVLSSVLFMKTRDNKRLRLSIGAPSSPLVSNIIMYSFDGIISSYCGVNSVKYTRYADDIAISSNNIENIKSAELFLANAVKSLKSPSLKFNKDKTFRGSMAGNRHVTGLVLSNDRKVSLGRAKKRAIRAELHKYLERREGAPDKSFLRGHLAFVHDVDPDFLNSLKAKYGDEKISSIMKS